MKRSSPVKDTVTEAKKYIYRLLKIRFRSEKEVRDKLRKKGFSEPTADEAVGYFKAVGLVDDRQFTRKWIASRLNKPFGIHRIRFELKEKGIAPELMKEDLEQAMSEYSEMDVAVRLAKHQALKHRDIPREKVKQRVYGYLLRRGFNPAIVMKAVQGI
ncbi:MAG: regulatory protein RecX [Candidatus Omnitrophica bacterium]|nr:regulatory protein RecX [Candidatus Omnitrophota bacterium]MBI5024066.1 regulatory protein RecX [Candidatus Omnitrophota bacterium]